MSGDVRVNGTARPSDPSYEWRYEYYDYEDPVSFEGLAAHRYSIVIVFWVGLAVFVIFMFFVLTLLAKTRAAHAEGREAVLKHGAHLARCMEPLNLNTLHASFPLDPLLQGAPSCALLPGQVHEVSTGDMGCSGTVAHSTVYGGLGTGAAGGNRSAGGLMSDGGAPGPPSDPAAPEPGAGNWETLENYDIPNVVH